MVGWRERETHRDGEHGHASLFASDRSSEQGYDKSWPSPMDR